MSRFFIDQKIEDPNNIIISDKEIINKLVKVLRKRVGDCFILFDNQGDEYEVEIREWNPKQIVCKFRNKLDNDRELDTDINLYVALLKADKFEWLLQKVTEIGVKKIIPNFTENCVVKELNNNKYQRYKKIINEATLQCGGKVQPVLNQVETFAKSLEYLNPNDLNIIAHEKEEKRLKEILADKKSSAINIFIGPEGGFSEEEINLAQRHSIIPISLGKRILRAETASMVACAIIANY
jgi:16S rRNA (uracil1498-N3)-methyltransferase